jgi:hypothetical protein
MASSTFLELAFDVLSELLLLSQAGGRFRLPGIVSSLLRVFQRYRIAEFGTNFFKGKPCSLERGCQLNFWNPDPCKRSV